MNTRQDATLHTTTSQDGTDIAYWSSGEGPPLVLVHGMTADHTTFAALVPHLRPHVTVHAMDRRGRGASHDAAEYALEREFEDVAAVTQAVAEASGSPVTIFGHSFGGLCAFGAAALTPSIGGLVLYEGWPSVGAGAYAVPASLIERLEALLVDDAREELLELFMREVVDLSDDELAMFRAAPAWANRVAAVHTIPREARAEHTAIFDPQQAVEITTPTLLLVGGQSPHDLLVESETIAATLPDARVSVIEGQQHTAHHAEPDVVSDLVVNFLRGRTGP